MSTISASRTLRAVGHYVDEVVRAPFEAEGAVLGEAEAAASSFLRRPYLAGASRAFLKRRGKNLNELGLVGGSVHSQPS